MSTESKTRVPLAYVGYWPLPVLLERIKQGNGRTNADFVENCPPHILKASMRAESLGNGTFRVELRWEPCWGLDVKDGNEVHRITAQEMYGEVDTSDWDLHPLYTPIHDPVLDGASPPYR